jgi:hypothetical protein
MAVARPQAAVGVAGAFVGGRGAVALEHLRGAPAGKAHERAIVAARGLPLVGEKGVAEHVQVHLHAGVVAMARQHLADAGGGHPARPPIQSADFRA